MIKLSQIEAGRLTAYYPAREVKHRVRMSQQTTNPKEQMSKIIHSMLRVLDLEKSCKFYADCFALLPSHRLHFPAFTLVYLRNAENDSEIELTWNKDRTEAYTHGDGYGHVGVCVPDAVADRARLTQLGYNPLDIKEFKNDDGSLIARYFFILDPDGYKVEVLERHGHYQ